MIPTSADQHDQDHENWETEDIYPGNHRYSQCSCQLILYQTMDPGKKNKYYHYKGTDWDSYVVSWTIIYN